jgi:NAD(P)-dependent dehydrogenase (short-subunit alcohol dehydrogenase family)
VEFVSADLSLVRETDTLVSELQRRLGSLHYLVHSAGTIRSHRSLTTEGFETMFATNFLTRVVLTNGLLPALERGGTPCTPAQLLFISGAAQGGRIEYEDPSLTRKFSLVRAVRQFCLANDLLALHLERTLRDSGDASRVNVHCLKLGVVRTNIRRTAPKWLRWLVSLVLDPLIGLTPEDAAAVALTLVRNPKPSSTVLLTYIRKPKLFTPAEELNNPLEQVRLAIWAERLADQARAPRA